MFNTRKINNAIVIPLHLTNQYPPEKIYGYDFCHHPYATWLLIAKSHSGKGHSIYKICEETIDSRMGTNVVIFCPTASIDPLYEKLQDLLEKKNCTVTIHSSFNEGKENILNELLDMMENEPEEDIVIEEEEELVRVGSSYHMAIRTKKKKAKRPKKISSRHLFIFDDMGSELRNPCMSFVMKSRHYKIKTIISTQYIHNITPAIRKNVSNVLFFKSFSPEKLRTIYTDLDITVPYEEFERLYQFATSKKYNFLQYDARDNRFIKNFNEEIEI